MHPNPAFRKTADAENLAFARDIGFGTLCTNNDPAPLISHIPFVVSPDGSKADFHLVRSNPIARALDNTQPAVLAVTGPNGYISPDWYGFADQVPTWNYIAVHIRGHLSVRPQDTLPDHLAELSARFENELDPKPAWTIDKMSDDALQKMMRMIVPCRLTIETIDGTWKLNQNKPDSARLSAAENVSDGIGQSLDQLSQHMRNPPAI